MIAMEGTEKIRTNYNRYQTCKRSDSIRALKMQGILILELARTLDESGEV